MQTEDRRYVIQAKTDSEAGRVSFMLENMAANKAYRYANSRNGNGSHIDDALLESFRERYRQYREGWRGYPKAAFAAGLHENYFKTTQHPPLCVDIETAAVCDLACPFCFRQSIATPDKIMREDLFNRIIEQCGELGVPSIKLNWRGEPLLNPKLAQFIDRAKKAGILEVIINTNAVTLDEKRARELIDAGLDLLIYSFDGGSKKTYEKMRPGRFKDNDFDAVYQNIRRFAEIRASLNSRFPRTKIQMILTKETFEEQPTFFNMFSDCVDDVSVKAYTERGGAIPTLDPETKEKLSNFLKAKSLPKNTPFWRDMNNRLFVSERRLPCEQPFQRLMVTFDGSVSMCCYDWGNEHPVGYLDQQAYQQREAQYEQVVEKVKSKARGFELLQDVVKPKQFSHPEKRVQTLREIWDGDIINAVRRAQAEDRYNDIAICKHCTFKETYQWLEVK